ncbi:protease inhibitor I42 family protein [Planosporangium sp. 12N6]|uniref:protease inhibitor I42 family protein n=1 Tax=Planosporangium spinosum TaxID=3402278 RepID=UPI003CF9FFB2
MTVRADLSDDGSTVVAAPGDTLEVALPENASTGYRWAFEPSPGLVILDDRVLPSSDQPGAGGERVFAVRVDAPGEVRARLRRSWEPPESAARSYTLRVRTD